MRDLTIRDTEIHTFSGDGVQVDPGAPAPGWDHVTIERVHIWLAPLPAPRTVSRPASCPAKTPSTPRRRAPSRARRLVVRDTIAPRFPRRAHRQHGGVQPQGVHGRHRGRVTVSDSEIAFRLRGAHRGRRVLVKNAVVHDVPTAFRYEDNIQNLRIWNSTVGANVTRAFQPASSSRRARGAQPAVLGTLPAEAKHASNLAVTASAFANAAMHDDTLAPGSPAIDSGEPLGDVTIDCVGVTRPRGAAFDVGAFELTTITRPNCEVTHSTTNSPFISRPWAGSRNSNGCSRCGWSSSSSVSGCSASRCVTFHGRV